MRWRKLALLLVDWKVTSKFKSPVEKAVTVEIIWIQDWNRMFIFMRWFSVPLQFRFSVSVVMLRNVESIASCHLFDERTNKQTFCEHNSWSSRSDFGANWTVVIFRVEPNAMIRNWAWSIRNLEGIIVILYSILHATQMAYSILIITVWRSMVWAHRDYILNILEVVEQHTIWDLMRKHICRVIWYKYAVHFQAQWRRCHESRWNFWS